MKYLFELLKDHETLPNSEVLACLRAEKINYDILESNRDVIVIATEGKYNEIEKVANRLSYTFFIDRFLFSCKNSSEIIKKYALKNKIENSGSIAIKYKNRSKTIDSQKIVRALAETYSKNRNVVLENPDIEIRGLITDSYIYIGVKLFEISRSQFEGRKVQFRPFFSPISLHFALNEVLN